MLIDWIEQHQAILTWLGGGVTTVAGGAWIVVRYLLDRSRDRPVSSLSDRLEPAHFPAPDGPKKASGNTVSTGTGIAAGGSMQISGNVSIQHNRIPKAAIAIAVFGLLLLGYAAFNSGNRIKVQNGSYVGGNVSGGSTIKVTPSK